MPVPAPHTCKDRPPPRTPRGRSHRKDEKADEESIVREILVMVALLMVIQRPHPDTGAKRHEDAVQIAV